jgi:ATP adenylyltransferase
VRVLWAPWRLSYIEGAAPNDGCIFCALPAREGAAARRAALVLASDDLAAVMMNRYPYAHAHLMVAPRRHTADLLDLDAETATALHNGVRAAVAALKAEYSPHGFNIGLNLGRAAGAGIADHLHWHVVPRWEGDTNFMPTLADTRVMPQHIEDTYDRLLRRFERLAGPRGAP